MVDKNAPATAAELNAVDQRITDTVDRLNEIGEAARKYVDECDSKQDERLNSLEERLTKLIKLKTNNYDKLVRRVVKTEFAKIGKKK